MAVTGFHRKYTYAYDTFGRRMSKPKSVADSSALTFCYAGGRIIAEYEGATLKRKYIYGAGLDEPICMIDAASGSRYYYFYDGLGSVAALSNNNNIIVEAYCYDAFGRTKINTDDGPDNNWLTPDGSTAAASQFGNRFMFTGREYDCETGLYYYRARMYSPVLGRFLQPDPIGYANSMNLYAYCGNNPVNWIDPWGLYSPENHHNILHDALRDKGLTPEQMNLLYRSNDWFDNTTQFPSDSYKHSMTDINQTEAEGLRLREQFKQEMLKKIKDSKAKRHKKGDNSEWSDEELEMFGQLQHAFADEYCISHNWEEWRTSDYLKNKNNYKTRHQAGDRDRTGVDDAINIVKDLWEQAR